MRKIKIAKGLAQILDDEIPRWGSIRKAIPYWFRTEVVEQVIALPKDEEFHTFYSHCLSFTKTQEIEVSDEFIKIVEQIFEQTSLSKEKAATLFIDHVRSLIRTSEELGYDY